MEDIFSTSVKMNKIRKTKYNKAFLDCYQSSDKTKPTVSSNGQGVCSGRVCSNEKNCNLINMV